MTYKIGDVIIVRHRGTHTALAVVTRITPPTKALKWVAGARARWAKRPCKVEPLRVADWRDVRRHVDTFYWDAVEKEVLLIAARFRKALPQPKE